MVRKYSPVGLIATTRVCAAPALEDLVIRSGWPLLLEASPRRLARELSLHDPQCVLFWLDEEHQITPTARLVEWSRERGSRPYRIAVAIGMAAEVEAVLRSAGAHTFVPISDRSGTVVTEDLRLLMAAAMPPPVQSKTRPRATSRDPIVAIETSPDLVRPP